MIPLVFGTPDQFATIKTFLDDTGYTAPEVADRAGVPVIYLFKQLRDGRQEGTSLDDALDLLIRLFMDAEMVDWKAVRRLLPPGIADALQGLGLLVSCRSAPERCQATVLLYPAGSQAEPGIGWPELYVVSDLNADADPADTSDLIADVVYPAVTLNTGVFLSFLPRKPCQHFLEVCSGTGIAALLASRFAERAWAADISPRAAHFAEFNIRLNGLTNVTTSCGDLYEAVKDLRFDRIVAHPPYVPAFKRQILFRDGGDDGEQITRRVIAGLPQYLRPGGRFYCTCRATDRKDARLEQRVRQWLGERERDFDILVVTMQEEDPAVHSAVEIAAGRLTLEEIRARLALFRRLEVERFVYGTIVVQRVSASRPSFTERRQVGAAASSAAVEWLLDWETAARDPGADSWLLQARPRVAERVELQMKQHRQKAGWRPVSCVTGTNWPFALGLECPLWAAALLEQCDGRLALSEHLTVLRETGALPAEGAVEALLAGVRALASAGVLEVDRHPIPPVPRSPGIREVERRPIPPPAQGAQPPAPVA